MNRTIRVKEGTKCPLCPNHYDPEDEFVWSNLLNAPICIACTWEILNGFMGYDKKPTQDQFNCADSMGRIEELTGLSFNQAKSAFLQELIEEEESYLNYEQSMMKEGQSRKQSIENLSKEILKLKSELARISVGEINGS